MLSALDRIRQRFLEEECEAGVIHKDGCCIGLSGAPYSLLIVDVDKCKSKASRKKCDYIVYVERTKESVDVLVIEMTTADISKNKIRQLREGAKFAESKMEGVSIKEFMPLAVTAKRLRSAAKRRFRNEEINLKGKNSMVQFELCCTLLSDILE